MLLILILFHVITLFLIYSENSKVRKEKARCEFINFHLYNVNMSILSQQRCSLLWKCWHINRKGSVKGLQMLFASYAFHLTTTSLWQILLWLLLTVTHPAVNQLSICKWQHTFYVTDIHKPKGTNIQQKEAFIQSKIK